MALERASAVVSRSHGVPQEKARSAGGGYSRPSDAFPGHVIDALAYLKAKFPIAKDAAEWDNDDLFDYGRQFLRLNPGQTKTVCRMLRERFRYRPSVADVRTAVDEIAGPKDATLPAYAAKTQRIVRIPPAPKHREIAGEVPAELPEAVRSGRISLATFYAMESAKARLRGRQNA